MNNNFNKLRFLLLLIFSIILFCFSSCSMRAEQKSLTGHFETIDALIMQNQFKDAIKELKKLEKSTYDSWGYIGIYKRYSRIGEDVLCEKLIKKALKKNKSNLELNAIYTKYLLSKNRIEEALKIGEILKGSKYGSLYSEGILKKAQQNATEDKLAFFKNEQFYQIYYDSYKSTRNPIWIRNCAVYDMNNGLYQKAYSFLPEAFADSMDSYFWALVCYDSKHYFDCVDTLDYSAKHFKALSVSQIALQSDSYIAISEMEKAENVRRSITQNIESITEKTEINEELLPLIMVNSAVWAKNQGLDNQCADLLFYTVNRWPGYVPALILYADFAYNSSIERIEDTEIKALRRAGIYSTEMERYDNRRKIPLSDAIYRLDKALAVDQNPYLSICKLDLTYKTNSKLSEKDKLRDLWILLEDTNEVSIEYKALLTQYAVHFLLNKNDIENAWNIFYSYVNKTAELNEKNRINPSEKKRRKDKSKSSSFISENFWDYFISNVSQYDLPVVEIAAWFAAQKGMKTEALRLYEYSVYESGGILEENVISPYVSTVSCINLADIYYSIGKKEKALDLYGKACGRESNNAMRSEMFYRIACIYIDNGDLKSALRSVDYSLSIYPENAKASLLKDKIR